MENTGVLATLWRLSGALHYIEVLSILLAIDKCCLQCIDIKSCHTDKSLIKDQSIKYPHINKY